MITQKEQFKQSAIRGALIGGFFGTVAAFACLNSSAPLQEFDSPVGSVFQALLQLCSGMLAGSTIGAASFAITVPERKSELGSVLQLFIAPTLFMHTICVAIYFACYSQSLFFNQIILAPLAIFSIGWTIMWTCLSLLAILLSCCVKWLD